MDPCSIAVSLRALGEHLGGVLDIYDVHVI
jgi:hypothetical protein